MSRQLLTAAINYYVRKDGSDANDGLTDSSGGAFLTVQHALNVIHGTLDLAGQVATVNVAAGTYAENILVRGPFVGASGPDSVVVSGRSSNPDDFRIDASGLGGWRSSGPTALNGAQFTLLNFSVKAPQGYGVFSKGPGSYIKVKNWKFLDLLRTSAQGANFEGAVFLAYEMGTVELRGGGVIAGSVDTIFNAQHNAQLLCYGDGADATVIFTGTLDISASVYSRNCSAVRFPDTTPGGGVSPDGGAWTFDTSGATLSNPNHAKFYVIQNATLQYCNGTWNKFPGAAIGREIAGGHYFVCNEPRSVVVPITRDISVTGAQGINCGFFPQTIIIIGSVNGSSKASFGAMGSSPAWNNYAFMRDNNGASAGTYATANGVANVLINLLQDGSNFANGAVTAKSDTGFTITWSKAGNPTGTFTGFAVCLP